MNYHSMLKNISLWKSIIGYHVIVITLTRNQITMDSTYIFLVF